MGYREHIGNGGFFIFPELRRDFSVPMFRFRNKTIPEAHGRTAIMRLKHRRQPLP